MQSVTRVFTCRTSAHKTVAHKEKQKGVQSDTKNDTADDALTRISIVITSRGPDHMTEMKRPWGSK
jgi:hypothetical protein